MKTMPLNTRPQFSLLGLLAFTTLFCVVFAVLAALGAPPRQTLLGFTLFSGIAGTIAVVVESVARLIGARQRW